MAILKMHFDKFMELLTINNNHIRIEIKAKAREKIELKIYLVHFK